MNIRQLIDRAYRKFRYKLKSISSNDYNERNKLFDDFEDSIPHTKVVTADRINEITHEFDGIIVGSDNVWRPESAFDDIVFLKFALKSQKKFAYAASIGVKKLTDAEMKLFEENLICFDEISVREAYSADMLQKLLNREVAYSVDPSMLLERSEWMLIEKTIELPENYLFVYMIDENPLIRQEIYEFARDKECQVVNIVHTQRRYKKSDEKYVDYSIVVCGPKEWLYLIHHAKYIFTDSFHGTVFSLIYNKQFMTINKRVKDAPLVEGRMSDLLENVGLADRLVDNMSATASIKHVIDEVNYGEVNKIIEKWVDESRKYLYKCLDY